MSIVHPPYRLGLIGHPLGHSLSPLLHHAALRAMGLVGEYRLYVIPPAPDGLPELMDLLARIRAGELDGLNVTIPHKQNVLASLDEASQAVRTVGAANTLFMRNGHFCGENTDVPGFLRDLEESLFKKLRGDIPGSDYTGQSAGANALVLGAGGAARAGANALVLGAGGAARAGAYALASAGYRVWVAARRLEQAQDLCADLVRLGGVAPGTLQSMSLAAGPLASLCESVSVDLVVNTTPVGMHPNVQANPWPQGLALPAGAAIYDMIYNPSETLFLRQARAEGLRAANGLGMLVEQAALALELWTGLPVPRAVMWDSVQGR